MCRGNSTFGDQFVIDCTCLRSQTLRKNRIGARTGADSMDRSARRPVPDWSAARTPRQVNRNDRRLEDGPLWQFGYGRGISLQPMRIRFWIRADTNALCGPWTRRSASTPMAAALQGF
jgi:hypothetical protein